MHVLTAADVDRPQSASTSTGQDSTKHDLFMDLYTGLISVGHGAGHDATEQDILFPVLYVIDLAGTKAIPVFHDPAQRPDEFRAAVASVSIAGFVDKTDPAIVQVLAAQADLRAVQLAPNGQTVHAVVLAATVKAQNSEVATLAYHVTVLRRHGPKQTLLTSIPAGSPDWDGTYQNISQNVSTPGTPQNS